MTHPAHSDRHRGTHGQPVHSITDADEARSAEQHSRIVKYTVSMSVRLACFIGAFFTHGPLQWALLAGAVVLPYFAVIIANGGADRTKKVHSNALLDAPPRWALGAPDAGAGSGAPRADASGSDASGPEAPESEAWSAGADSWVADAAEPGAGTPTGGGTVPVLLEGELVEDAQPDDAPRGSPGPSAAAGAGGTDAHSNTPDPSSRAQGRP